MKTVRKYEDFDTEKEMEYGTRFGVPYPGNHTDNPNKPKDINFTEEQWEKMVGTDTRNKVLMYNFKTGDLKLTRMKMNHPKFEETFAGYQPIGTIKGMNVTCEKLYSPEAY